jgi:inner membrane protein
VWLLVYDRQSQSQQASGSITQGWGDAQAMTGPTLVIPYRATATETVIEKGQSVTRSRDVVKELALSPEIVRISTDLKPERRKRSIYQAVVYEASTRGQAKFQFPPDLARHGVPVGTMDLNRAELRFGLSDPRGLGSNPRVSVGGQVLRLQPGGGTSGGRGFFAWVDAAPLNGGAIIVDFDYAFRGNASIALMPDAGETRWTVRSPWPHPSFGGAFLPSQRKVDQTGFKATYGVGNLALGTSLVTTGDVGTSVRRMSGPDVAVPGTVGPSSGQNAQIDLIQPVDLYAQVNRAAKYGFLFIGFTFLALLMFDIIGGVRVSAVEYLLMGAALILFFVLLLAFAEVIGFTPAYILASAAIAGLITAYSAAVLRSWRRAGMIGGLLGGLYTVLYILLSLEDFSLLIGSLLLFVALAGVMYATRRIDWSGVRSKAEVGESAPLG